MFPEKDSLTVMVRLSDSQFIAVYNKVSDYARAYINNRYPCNDSGWIHYRVFCPEQYEDIVTLLQLKSG